jgi:LPS-assembly lipoprotein
MRSSLRLSLVALLVAMIAGCGFQLRGAYVLPYESIFLSVGDVSVVGAGLKRAIRASGSTRIADSAKDAQAIFVPTAELREPVILSLSSAGRVREKRLRYVYGYRIVDNKGRDLVLPGVVELNRDLTYADSDVLAKTQEEDLLWRDMENDLVQQLMRRLAATKPVPPAAAE